MTTISDRESGVVHILVSEHTRQAFCRALVRSYTDILGRLAVDLPYIPKRVTLLHRCDKLKPIVVQELEARKRPPFKYEYWFHLTGAQFLNLLVGTYAMASVDEAREHLREWVGGRLPTDQSEP